MLSIISDKLTSAFDNPIKFANIVHVESTGTNRESARFILVEETARIVLSGTYDELLDLSAKIAESAMSWPLVNGRDDWFAEGESTTDEGTASSVGNDGS